MSSPSMRTANVSGSTVMSGSGVVLTRSALVSPRQSSTATDACRQPEPLGQHRRPAQPAPRRRQARRRGGLGLRAEHRPGSTGCGVGIDALASPICAQAIKPPLTHDVRPHPEELRIPQHQIGELAHLDRADLASSRGPSPGRSCTWPRSAWPARCRPAPSPGNAPRRAFITCAVCHVRMTTSPTRPMACESEPIIEIAPRSCRTSSAAIVDGRMRLSANARSSGTDGLRWWQTMSMSRCSSPCSPCAAASGWSSDGSTLGHRHTVMMSGAWPPPAPSVWYVWIDRPAIAPSVVST
jgi:hypothetical protein